MGITKMTLLVGALMLSAANALVPLRDGDRISFSVFSDEKTYEGCVKGRTAEGKYIVKFDLDEGNYTHLFERQQLRPQLAAGDRVAVKLSHWKKEQAGVVKVRAARGKYIVKFDGCEDVATGRGDSVRIIKKYRENAKKSCSRETLQRLKNHQEQLVQKQRSKRNIGKGDSCVPFLESAAAQFARLQMWSALYTQ